MTYMKLELLEDFVTYNSFMTTLELQIMVQDIVKGAVALKNKHTDQINAPVNYACVFTHSQKEYELLKNVAGQMGTVLEETDKGPLFHITPLHTVAGDLKILKIRMPFDDRPERGDADFTVHDYENFKKTYLFQPGFSLIHKPSFEMVELLDPEFDVLAYFSHPPLDEQYGL